MRKLIPVAVLLAIGCGGAEAAPPHAATSQAIACDWCPGLPAAMQCEYTLGGITEHVCRCRESTTSPGTDAVDLVIRVDPPLTQQDAPYPIAEQCARVQATWTAACPNPVLFTPHAACP